MLQDGLTLRLTPLNAAQYQEKRAREQAKTRRQANPNIVLLDQSTGRREGVNQKDAGHGIERQTKKQNSRVAYLTRRDQDEESEEQRETRRQRYNKEVKGRGAHRWVPKIPLHQEPEK